MTDYKGLKAVVPDYFPIDALFRHRGGSFFPDIGEGVVPSQYADEVVRKIERNGGKAYIV